MIDRLIEESQGITIIVHDIRRTDDAQKQHRSTKYLSEIRANLMSRKQEADDLEAPIIHSTLLLWNEVLEKESAIRQLLDLLCRKHAAIPFDYAWRAILEREKQGATFIGAEIAIPHARLEGIDTTVLAIGVSKLGICDPESSNTATIMFLMLSPINRPDSHIKLLGMISKMAGDRQWCAAMHQAKSDLEVTEILRRWIAGQKKK